MKLIISDIVIEVYKKNIKNIYLRVRPSNGSVYISAPVCVSDEYIEKFIYKNINWIKNQVNKFKDNDKYIKKQFVSGEYLYIWGDKYFLDFKETSYKNSFKVEGDKVILCMRSNTSFKNREKYVKEQYRLILELEIKKLLPKWERITNLYSNSFRTKYMITRWGTCNVENKRLWFNVKLAQRPKECLEYVILHELIHLKERSHSSVFWGYVEKYMSNWRDIRRILNDSKYD